MVIRISSYSDYRRIFWGELKCSISGSLGGSKSFASILGFLSRDFNVCIKPPGNVYGLEIRHGICSRLNFGQGIFWDFDFCTHSIITVT